MEARHLKSRIWNSLFNQPSRRYHRRPRWQKALIAMVLIGAVGGGAWQWQQLLTIDRALAADTGARTATSTSDCVDDATVGTQAWTSPGNAAVFGGTSATISTNASVTSHYLKCTNFGFSGLIPAGSTIDGIEMIVGRNGGVFGTTKDNAVRLIKGGVIGTTDKKSATNWPQSVAATTYGGASDLWGDTWTIADIESSGFGAVISATLTYSFFQVQANVDYIQLKVHYSPPPVTIVQSGYRFYANADSTDVGAPLAALNSPVTLTSTGQEFRLRMLADVAVNPLTVGRKFNLEFVDPGSGSCASPSGGTPASWTKVMTGNPGEVWTQVTPSILINTTSNPSMTNLNGTLFMVVNGSMYTSSDGTNWTQRNSPPGGIQSTTLLAFDNKVWVLGGYGYSGGFVTLDDVSYTTDGITYTSATATPGWAARMGHSAAVFDGKMWIMGGNTATSGSAGLVNDVWYSSDGVNWTQATSGAGWTARTHFGLAVKDNKLWVVGGWDNVSTVYGDVWSSTDGASWTQVAATTDVGNRRGPAVTAIDDKLVLMGGSPDNQGSTGKSDVWVSTDGITWTQVTASPGWGHKTYATVAVRNGELWLFGGITDGGNATNDLWRAEASTIIAFHNNATPAGGSALTTNANDPTHSGHTIVAQSYAESNPVNTLSQIPTGQDGMWDFSLVDSSAPAGTTFCFRMVESDGTVFDTYSAYPTFTTFDPSAVDPTPQMDQLMRGGKWFNDGELQPYTF